MTIGKRKKSSPRSDLSSVFSARGGTEAGALDAMLCRGREARGNSKKNVLGGKKDAPFKISIMFGGGVEPPGSVRDFDEREKKNSTFRLSRPSNLQQANGKQCKRRGRRLRLAPTGRREMD